MCGDRERGTDYSMEMCGDRERGKEIYSGREIDLAMETYMYIDGEEGTYVARDGDGKREKDEDGPRDGGKREKMQWWGEIVMERGRRERASDGARARQIGK